MEGTVVKARSNVSPLSYAWPARVGQDLNRLPIPMYRYHLTESTRIAINQIRSSLISSSGVMNSLFSEKGFYSHICYDKNDSADGRTYKDMSGKITLSNKSFYDQQSLRVILLHELFHRKFWIKGIDSKFEVQEEIAAQTSAQLLSGSETLQESNNQIRHYNDVLTMDDKSWIIKYFKEDPKLGQELYDLYRSSNKQPLISTSEKSIYTINSISDSLCD